MKQSESIREVYFSDEFKYDKTKLKRLHTASELLDEKYGKRGTPTRQKFQDEALAWYYGEILKDRRKELKMTQQELADKVGTARSYISRIEKGETDIQLSNFFKIASALGIEFTPVYQAI